MWNKAIALLAVLLASVWVPAHAATTTCNGNTLAGQGLVIGVTDVPKVQPDLLVTGNCIVEGGTYYFGRVNIVDKGKLIFKEGPASDPADRKKTNFWASSIIIESGGEMLAGVGNEPPYGTNGHQLNIYLYGADPGRGKRVGATCIMPRPEDQAERKKQGKTDLADCGVPTEVWNAGDADENAKRVLPNTTVADYFYKYGVVHGDDAPTGTTQIAHFGTKVLALSYNGTLQLRGYKGTTEGRIIDDNAARAAKAPTKPIGWTDEYAKVNTGTSWARLAVDMKKDGSGTITVDRPVEGDWQIGDEIVVSPTDYVPSHGEKFVITNVKGSDVTVAGKFKWAHNGTKFNTAKWLANADSKFTTSGIDRNLLTAAETRAAVGLLTRSIRIISGGDYPGDTFDDATNGRRNKQDSGKWDVPPNPNYAYGGHTVFRQGFKLLQLQGVEFKQLGQGGRLGHYPVHFHMARNVPADMKTDTYTFIRDSSVNESMTRWYVLHSTNGVLLQRNVGWKSIGHGFFLEDGTETNNKFYANLGVYARAAVKGPDNDRNIAGIFAAPRDYQPKDEPIRTPAFPFLSDAVYPTIFWITNGWNEFVGNMAAGAGTCGACYWLLPAWNHDMQETSTGHNMSPMKWSSGYSGTNRLIGGGATPLKVFYKNYCSTAMHAIDTTSDISDCLGVTYPVSPEDKKLVPIVGEAPVPTKERDKDPYYPRFETNRAPTICDPTKPYTQAGSCGDPAMKCSNGNPTNCDAYVIDHFTTSFNWAETNFSAVWLRNPGWFVMDNSFVSDVQNGGVTLVSGGDYSTSSSPIGYWALISHSIFVGVTQLGADDKPNNPYSLPEGPCKALNCPIEFGNTRISYNDSVVYPLSDFATNQRMFNIYDGPAHQDANAYLNIRVTPCRNTPDCMYFTKPGVRKDTGKGDETGYLPNAAIGWKQPNGFYYPPAFHSRNLYFKGVDIRHYVVAPLLEQGQYITDNAATQKNYAGIPGGRRAFASFTDVDRQTVLNDDDGTLTGFIGTISVNEDAFFAAPTQAYECKSNRGVDPEVACEDKKDPNTQRSPTLPSARTSPYDYVTTVVYPECATLPHFSDMYNACGSTGRGGDKPEDKGIPGARFLAKEWRGGLWSRDCTAPFCTGLPLYRQYLTGDRVTNGEGKLLPTSTKEWKDWLDNKCETDPTNRACGPMARMAGTNTWQRSVLTANNGVFYIDTTRSQLGQRKDPALGDKSDEAANYTECEFKPTGDCNPRSVTTFVKNGTYYVFILFAKDGANGTRQTYQLYVGKDFNLATVKTALMVGREINFKVETKEGLPAGWEKKLIGQHDGDAKYANEDKDILQVTVDFSNLTIDKKKVSLEPSKEPKQTCKPSTFCSWQGSTCGCSLKPNDPRVVVNPKLMDICKQTCGTWAVRDLDCPEIGCVGFAFTLGDKFEATDQYKRPTPRPFPKDDTIVWGPNKEKLPNPWRTVFKNVDQALAGDCFYSAANTPNPFKGDCKVPK